MATSPVYVDGIPAALATPPVSPGTRISRDQRFWSSVPRPPGSQLQENLFVSLAKPQLINYLSFDLPHFPHQFTVYWLDGNMEWQPVLWRGGTPLNVVINGSVPLQVNSPAALAAGLNPYHYGAGHWIHFDEMIQPVLTTQFLFTCSRAGVTTLPPWIPPTDSGGSPVPYPLGIRDLDLGYRVLHRDDVPWTGRSTTVTERLPWTSTDDVHGSPMTVAVRENRASDLLSGYPWWSEAQPRADSVVNLYVDSRDVYGDPQVIDRFYLDPITSGVRVNLYSSAAPPPPGSAFTASDTPLDFPAVQTGGGTIPQVSAEGLLLPAGGGWLVLTAQAAGMISGNPWWAAIAICPQFSSSDPGAYLIADTLVFQLWYSDGVFLATSGDGTTMAQWDAAFDIGDELVFAVVFSGTSLSFWMAGQSIFSVPASALDPVPAISFGNALQQTADESPIGSILDPLNGNYLLVSVVIKQESMEILEGPSDELMAFASDPAGYVYPAEGPGSIANAAVLFSPQYVVEGINTYGFAGGINQAYEACSWTPVTRDFKAARGYMEFEPTLASVFKFEFTSLHPETYDYIAPVAKPGKTIPITIGSHPVPPINPAVIDNGLTANMNITPSVVYNDAPPAQAPYSAGTSLPRQVVYATDPATADQMAQAGGSLYDWQQWKPASQIPMQVAAGPHGYGEYDFEQRSRVAYFVALSSLIMYRVDYTAQDDTEEYFESFGDLANMLPAPEPVYIGGDSYLTDYEVTYGTTVQNISPPYAAWLWEPGSLSTPSNLAIPALAQSLVFSSDHTVSAVQFATTQSDPVQILPDPDFAEPGIPTWQSAGDALPVTVAAGIDTQLGAMAQVIRQPSAYTWSSLQDAFGTWADLLAATPTWNSLGVSQASNAYGGITCVAPQFTTAAGRVYAAVRVFAPQSLTQPLALQILDGATGTVLSEELNPVTGGVVTEWYTGYTIGSADLTSVLTWAEVQTANPEWSSFTGDIWSQVDLSIQPLGQTLTVQLIQYGVTSDTWGVDNISLFEDAIVWSFSNDGGNSWYPAYEIRNNPSGVLVFPAPAQGTGNQLCWMAEGYRPDLYISSLAIRPWYSAFPTGVPPRSAGIGHGPNISPLDHYPAIQDDPRWQAWDSPIPQTWYFTYQQLMLAGAVYVPVPETVNGSGTVLGNALVIPAATAAPSPTEEPIWDDVYVDVFLDSFAVGGAGDVFDDTFDDVYAEEYPVAVTGVAREASVTLAAPSSLVATVLTVPPARPLAGASLGLVPGNDVAVSSFIATTSETLALRRLYLGNQIPVSLAASDAAFDAGVRKVFFDFRPDATTSPAQLAAFLSSCQAGGLDASVSLWSSPDKAFSDPRDYFTICQQYVPVIREYGYDHVFVMSTTSVMEEDALFVWFPGTDVTDAMSVSFYYKGLVPGAPQAETLAEAAIFAASAGLPFGLAEFGVDWGKYTEKEGKAFLTYVLEFLRETPQPLGDCVYLSAGSYTLMNAPVSWVSLYRQIAALLAGKL